jgi:ferredoxin
MATMITSECINCGACEPECPNTAIYQGGVEWELNGQMHPALANDIFYIVPEKCTECVGFYDHEACAAVCPVDCCIPNPDIPETEDVLLARARQLHPDTDFPAEFPSRFKAGGGSEAPKPAAAVAEPKAAPAAAAPQPVAAAKPVAAGPARAERPISAPKTAAAPKRPPRKEKTFPGELPLSFDEALALLRGSSAGRNAPAKWLVAVAQPVLGALPFGQKKALERGIGDRRFFSAAGATALNALHNVLLYPLIAILFGVLVLDRSVFTNQLNGLIFLGLTVAVLETIFRMREGFRGRPADQIVYRAALYGVALAPLAAPLVKLLQANAPQGSVGLDGFTDQRFEPKLERERRYGEVYRLREEPNGFLLEVEFPRTIPPSAIKEQLGIGDEMPDYDYDLSLQNGFFIVKGNLPDKDVRRVAAVSPAFPPDFATQIKLPSPVAGFRHRFRGKDLEVALLKRV